MKYMGSKTALLRGELGTLLIREAMQATRFVDLFAGSGAVSHHVAEQLDLPVLSVDLQHYSKMLTGCVTERVEDLRADYELLQWISTAEAWQTSDASYMDLADGEVGNVSVARDRARAQDMKYGFIVRGYGGHYYSLQQAHALDRLYSTMPKVGVQRTLALAALLHAASVCAAAPGHTAQPFQPTKSLLPYIRTAWSRDAVAEAKKAFEMLAPRRAKVAGRAVVADAATIVEQLTDGDLVFCDPPYSAAQYSRFYHVLEGISVGGWSEVSGAGRAPARESREASAFSMKSMATAAMKDLLDALYRKRCRVVITFPNAEASNGLSGNEIIGLANDAWNVSTHLVDSVHSTLGGTSTAGGGRGGRRNVKEAVIVLNPKPRSTTIPWMESFTTKADMELDGSHTAGYERDKVSA